LASPPVFSNNDFFPSANLNLTRGLSSLTARIAEPLHLPRVGDSPADRSFGELASVAGGFHFLLLAGTLLVKLLNRLHFTQKRTHKFNFCAKALKKFINSL
jgi:hypothetical protein